MISATVGSIRYSLIPSGVVLQVPGGPAPNILRVISFSPWMYSIMMSSIRLGS